MEKAKRGFAIHLIVYAIANVVLIAINLVHAPKTIWFFYPYWGWASYGGFLSRISSFIDRFAVTNRSNYYLTLQYLIDYSVIPYS